MGTKPTWRKNHLKSGCKQNAFQALRHKQTLCPVESMPGFPKGNAGTKHCTSEPFPSPMSAAVLMHGKVEVAQLTSVQSPWNKSHLGSNSALSTHTLQLLTLLLSCHSFFFSLWLKLVLPHFWCMQIKLLLLSRKHTEETYNSIVAFMGLNDKVFSIHFHTWNSVITAEIFRAAMKI